MPRTEEANQRIREEQRAKILDAAWKVFARKGVTATMAEVAEAAGVSYGLAYRYFANKEALFQALVERAIKAGPARLRSFLERPGTPGERLDYMVIWLVESRREHSELFQLFDQVLSDETTPDDLRKQLRKEIHDIFDVLRQLIVEGQASGEVAANDPDQLVRAILSCLNGLTRWAVHHPEEVARQFPDPGIILRMLKPPADRTSV